MPHLTVQYTANLDGYDADAALAALNGALAACGHFDELAIKSRAWVLDHYRIGTADRGRAFVHAQLKILPGRSEAVRGDLSAIVLAPCAAACRRIIRPCSCASKSTSCTHPPTPRPS